MARRLRRWLLVGLGMVGLLVLLVIVLLWLFFPSERLRQYLVSTLERRLQWPVQVGVMQWRGLSLTLSDLRVADDDPQAPDLFRVDSVRLRLSLRHILARRPSPISPSPWKATSPCRPVPGSASTCG